MPLVQLLIVLIVLGLVWYLIETFLPIAEPFKMVIRIVIVLILILYLLGLIGVVPSLRIR